MSSSLHGVMHVVDSVSNKSRPLTLANNVLAVDNSANTQPVSLMALPLPSGAAVESKQDDIVSALSGLALDSSLSGLGTASNQSTANGHLSAIESSLSGVVSVSQAALKSASTVNSASSVASGDYSSAHACLSDRKLAIFGDTTDFSNNIDVYVSDDGIAYYKFGQYSIFPDSAGNFGIMLDAPFKFVKLRYNGSATVTALIVGVN